MVRAHTAHTPGHPQRNARCCEPLLHPLRGGPYAVPWPVQKAPDDKQCATRLCQFNFQPAFTDSNARALFKYKRLHNYSSSDLCVRLQQHPSPPKSNCSCLACAKITGALGPLLATSPSRRGTNPRSGEYTSSVAASFPIDHQSMLIGQIGGLQTQTGRSKSDFYRSW